MAQFALACAIMELVFPRKRSSAGLNNSLRRSPREEGYALRSCVQSFSHTAAQSRRKMRMAAVRGSTLLFRRAPKLQLYDDPSKQPGLRDRRRPVGAEGSYSTTTLRRIPKPNF